MFTGGWVYSEVPPSPLYTRMYKNKQNLYLTGQKPVAGLPVPSSHAPDGFCTLGPPAELYPQIRQTLASRVQL